MSETPGVEAPRATDPRVLVKVAQDLPGRTGPNAALAVIRDIRSDNWDRQHNVKQLLRSLRDEDVAAFRSPQGEMTPAAWILEAGRALSQNSDRDPTEKNLNAWLSDQNAGLRVGNFARGEHLRRGYRYPAHEAAELVLAQVQLQTIRDLTELGVHADPVAALKAEPARLERARAALAALREQNPELNVDKAEDLATAVLAAQDAKAHRREARSEFGTELKGSAHTKSAIALTTAGSAGYTAVEAGTDLSTGTALLLGVGLPSVYAVVDKVLNRNPDAPTPVRDAGRTLSNAIGAVGDAKHQVKDAKKAMKQSFKPQRTAGQTR